MKSTASAVEISAAKSAARASPPTQGGRTSVVRRGRASSGFASPGSTARMAMPKRAGTNANAASAAALPRAAQRAADAERAPKVFWTRPGETKNDGTKTTTRPRIPATPIPVKLP